MGTPKASKLLLTAATVSLFYLSVSGLALIPSKNYGLDTEKTLYGAKWESGTGTNFYEAAAGLDKIEVLYQFGAKLIEGTETLDPEIARLINSNLSQLI